jgi:hypothetical protein
VIEFDDDDDEGDEGDNDVRGMPKGEDRTPDIAAGRRHVRRRSERRLRWHIPRLGRR